MSQHDLDPDAAQYLLDSGRLRKFLRALRGGGRVRVDGDQVWKALAANYPQLPQGIEGRRWLMSALKTLESQGHVRLPVAHGKRWDRSSAVPLPLSIDLARPQPAGPKSDWRSFPWHRSLQWALECSTLTPEQVSFLHRVHEGLVSGAFAEPASFKYRSLQLTGNEKRLASLVKTQLFRPGRLTLEAIGCEPDVLPLTWETVSSCRKMVIFENAGAYMVGLRVLRALPDPPYGRVAYGCGFDVLKSIGYLRAVELDVSSIDYVGDLDLKGLEIAVSLRKVTGRLGLARPCPATSLHRAMLQSAANLGAPDGWPAGTVPASSPLKELLNFIDPSLRNRVETILGKEQRNDIGRIVDLDVAQRHSEAAFELLARPANIGVDLPVAGPGVEEHRLPARGLRDLAPGTLGRLPSNGGCAAGPRQGEE